MVGRSTDLVASPKAPFTHIDIVRRHPALVEKSKLSYVKEGKHIMWEFPKIGDPNIAPQKVGSYPKIRYP